MWVTRQDRAGWLLPKWGSEMPKRPRIDNRRDILLLLLYSPGSSDTPNEPILGRTRIVKMLFVFKHEALSHFRRGTLINDANFYEFFPWSYGPFSSEVYDDLNFFILRGFVESDAVDDDATPQSLAEWEHWLAGSSSGYEPDVTDYFEESFRLTAKGVEWTAPLYAELSENQRFTLRTFKRHMATMPLRALLKYVYQQYPSYTERSTIRGKVLDDG